MNKYFVLLDKDGNFFSPHKVNYRDPLLSNSLILNKYKYAARYANINPDFTIKELTFELKEPIQLLSSEFKNSEEIILFSHKSFHILKYDFHNMASSVYYSIVREEWIRTTGINFSILDEFKVSLEQGKELLQILRKPLYEEIKSC